VSATGVVGEVTDQLRQAMGRDWKGKISLLCYALAIPLAAGVLAAWGIVLPAAMGAVLMSLSTIVVAANAQLLRRTDL
jgi:hypothetical protein